MFEYLQPADRPVIDGLDAHEVVMAKDQPEYIPLRCLVGNTPQGERLSRWTLTPEQRAAIADGADIFLELLTFDRPMNPIRIAISDNPNPDWFRAAYRLESRTEKDCRCDCVNCATGHHDGCYYEPKCPLSGQSPAAAAEAKEADVNEG